MRRNEQTLTRRASASFAGRWRRAVGLLCLSSTARVAIAQVAAGNVKGEGPVIAAQAGSIGILRFATADKRASLNYLNRKSGDTPFFGFDASAAVTNSIGSLFRTGDVAPDGKVSVFFGKTGLATSAANQNSNDVDWFDVRIGVEGTKVVTFDTSQTFGNQIVNHAFSGASAALTYHYFMLGTTIWSIGVGYDRQNNADDLDEVEVATQQKVTDPVTGAVRTASGKVTAKQGVYEERGEYPLGIDYFIKPDAGSPIGLSAFVHQVLAKGKPKTNAGAGMWLLDEKRLSQAKAGIVAQIDDAFDAYPSRGSTNIGKHFSASLIVGVSLF